MSLATHTHTRARRHARTESKRAREREQEREKGEIVLERMGRITEGLKVGDGKKDGLILRGENKQQMLTLFKVS